MRQLPHSPWNRLPQDPLFGTVRLIHPGMMPAIPFRAYTISTPEQLAGLASLVNVGNSFADVTFTLANDMNLNSESSSTNWTPIGTASVTLGGNRQATVDVDSATPFAGIFDGDGFAINGLYISSDANMQGLFGYVTGEVKNLTINGDITSTALEDDPYTNKCVGSVAAFNHKGTIADVINNVTVNAPNTYFVGGITGYNLEVPSPVPLTWPQ